MLQIIVAAIAGVALTAYVLFGGADYGGGVWDLLASGPRREKQRELIAHAIGPIWEANHVWLILIVVLLFTCFPPAFAAIMTVLHIPITLLLIGIVLRGSAFTFRAYDATHSAVQERWGMIFAIASVLAPVLLGVIVGAIASNGVGTAMGTLGESGIEFVPVFITPWLNAFTLAVGIMTLVLVAFLAATYLTVEAAHDTELQNDFRRRAIEAGLVLPVTAYGPPTIATITAADITASAFREPASSLARSVMAPATRLSPAGSHVVSPARMSSSVRLVTSAPYRSRQARGDSASSRRVTRRFMTGPS